MDEKQIIKEYNERYTANPKLYQSEERSEFAYNVVKQHVEPTSIIDIGCGNGYTLGYFKELYPDADITGLDISDVAVKLAQDLIPDANMVHGFIEEFYSRKKYDLILNMGSLEHVENLKQALINTKKLLKKDGVLYFEAPDNLSYSPGREEWRRLKRGSRQMEWHLSKQSWEELFNALGFEIVEYHQGRRPFWKNIWVLK